MTTDEKSLTAPNLPGTGAGGWREWTYQDKKDFAAIVVKARMAPKGIERPEQAFVALQTGMEAGMSPMASIRSVYVVNGSPGWVGTAALALIRRSGLLKPQTQITLQVVGDGDDQYGEMITWRAGDPAPQRSTWSVREAKRSGQWGKAGPWTNYPSRMLKWAAVSEHTKLHWSDVLMGLELAEILEDYPPEAMPRGATMSTAAAPGNDPLLAAMTPDPVVAAAAEIMGGQGVPDPLDERTDAEKVRGPTAAQIEAAEKRVTDLPPIQSVVNELMGPQDAKTYSQAARFHGELFNPHATTEEIIKAELEDREGRERELHEAAAGFDPDLDAHPDPEETDHEEEDAVAKLEKWMTEDPKQQPLMPEEPELDPRTGEVIPPVSEDLGDA